MKISKIKFIDIFCDGNMTDEDRVKWLLENKDNLAEYKINIDNDSVFITFDDEDELDEPTILDFDEFGYHILVPIFNAIGLKSDFV